MLSADGTHEQILGFANLVDDPPQWYFLPAFQGVRRPLLRFLLVSRDGFLSFRCPAILLDLAAISQSPGAHDAVAAAAYEEVGVADTAETGDPLGVVRTVEGGERLTGLGRVHVNVAVLGPRGKDRGLERADGVHRCGMLRKYQVRVLRRLLFCLFFVGRRVEIEHLCGEVVTTSDYNYRLPMLMKDELNDHHGKLRYSRLQLLIR